MHGHGHLCSARYFILRNANANAWLKCPSFFLGLELPGMEGSFRVEEQPANVGHARAQNPVDSKVVFTNDPTAISFPPTRKANQYNISAIPTELRSS